MKSFYTSTLGAVGRAGYLASAMIFATVHIHLRTKWEFPQKHFTTLYVISQSQQPETLQHIIPLITMFKFGYILDDLAKKYFNFLVYNNPKSSCWKWCIRDIRRGLVRGQGTPLQLVDNCKIYEPIFHIVSYQENFRLQWFRNIILLKLWELKCLMY